MRENLYEERKGKDKCMASPKKICLFVYVSVTYKGVHTPSIWLCVQWAIIEFIDFAHIIENTLVQNYLEKIIMLNTYCQIIVITAQSHVLPK